MIKFIIVAILISAAYYYNYYEFEPIKNEGGFAVLGRPFLKSDFTNLRDTLYTLKPNYIEIDLKRQLGYFHTRDGIKRIFRISSGTDKVEDGITTNEGVYVIQWKKRKWHSQQFDSTLMLNWMSFNYGIGFHALEGYTYYRYLGLRSNSHGCVRLSREDAQEVYQKVTIGTPVLIHSGNNAVHIGFADSNQPLTKHSYAYLLKIIPKRLKSLYEGKYYYDLKEKLLLEQENVNHTGLPIGDSHNIPNKQYIPIVQITFYSTANDKLKKTVNYASQISFEDSLMSMDADK